MNLKTLSGAAFGVILGMSIGADSGDRSGPSKLAGLFDLSVAPAHARPVRGTARRTTRRTARRTTRKVARRTSVAGCAVWRVNYWNCGGVYYQAVVQGGTTVYVVVNP